MDSDKKAIPERSVETQMVADCFAALEPGGDVTWEELMELLGASNREQIRGNVSAARKIVLREHRMVVDNVRNLGYRRLKADTVVQSEATAKRIRRLSRLRIKRLLSVDYDSLSDDMKREHNIGVAMAGVIAHATTKKARAQLGNTTTNSSVQKIPLPKALNALAAAE